MAPFGEGSARRNRGGSRLRFSKPSSVEIILRLSTLETHSLGFFHRVLSLPNSTLAPLAASLSGVFFWFFARLRGDKRAHGRHC